MVRVTDVMTRDESDFISEVPLSIIMMQVRVLGREVFVLLRKLFVV